MKRKTMQKATEGNLKESILNALENAAKIYEERAGVHIKKAPEYFLNTFIVKEVCDNFQRVGFRLEMKFSELFIKFGKKPIFTGNIKKGSKFDIVLTSRSSGKPRHVIEVKRSIARKQMEKEARRIRFVAESDLGSERLEKGFIACVTREKEKGKSAEVLLANRMELIQSIVGEGFKVSKKHKERNFGEFGFPSNEKLLLVVFEIKKI